MTTRTVIEARLAAVERRKAATLQALQQQRAKLKAKLAAFDRPSKSQRRLDARRKLLLGGFVVETMQHAGLATQALSFQGKRFLDWLVRPNDRALFGEPPASIPASPPSAAPPPGPKADAPADSLRGNEPQRDVGAGKRRRGAKPRAAAEAR
jgi:hypothetical protein